MTTPSASRELLLADTAATEALGARLARWPQAAGAVIWLQGDLGAGKTTLVRGLLQALGHRGAVKSPTYTLIEPYVLGARRLYHLDLYRLTDPEELEFLGVRDLARELEDGATVVVEWPARGAGFLPAPDAVVTLEPEGEGRRARIEARSARAGELLKLLGE